MKNIFKNILCLIITLTIVTSCSESDLDVPMYGSSEDKEYNNLEEVSEALTVCYYYLKPTWNELSNKIMFFNDIGSDDCDKGGADLTDVGELEQLESFNIRTTNGYIYDLWKTSYKGIYQVNLLLDKAKVFREKNSLTDRETQLLTQYENEARWLRGFYYFNLVYFFGDVPLFLHAERPDGIYKERSAANIVWQQVIDDFTEATNLPKRSDYAEADMGRATSGAAYAMLGRVHWFLHDFEKTKIALGVLVDGEQKNEYELDPDFATQWLVHNGNVKESIFEIQYKTNGKNWDVSTGWDGTFFLPNSEGGYEFHLPTQQLFEAFDPEDPRITWTFVKKGDKFKGNTGMVEGRHSSRVLFDRKHFFPISETSNAPSPIYVTDLVATNYIIRYADVLLMYAEAAMETGDLTAAKQNLNMVRQRARQSSVLDPKREIQNYVPNTQVSSLPDVTTGDKSRLQQYIWNERRCEFACEGLRRMDLIQQQRYGKVMTDYYNATFTKENSNKGRYYSKQKELYPIPQGEIDLSKGALTQNEGY